MSKHHHFSPGGEKKKKKPCVRIWLLSEGKLEPLTKENEMLKYTAKTIVPPGQGLNLNLVPDEPIDVREDGTFATSAVVSGDSNAPDIKPTSNANSIDVLLRGDGSIGVKVVSVTVDASVGPADVPLTIEITYTVDHPNATDFKTVTEGTLEALP